MIRQPCHFFPFASYSYCRFCRLFEFFSQHFTTPAAGFVSTSCHRSHIFHTFPLHKFRVRRFLVPILSVSFAPISITLTLRLPRFVSSLLFILSISRHSMHHTVLRSSPFLSVGFFLFSVLV